MKQQQASSPTSRAWAPKPVLAVVAKEEGTSLAIALAATIARDELVRGTAHALCEARGGGFDGHELKDRLQAEARIARAEPPTSRSSH